MHYIFQDWFFEFLTKALVFPAHKEISKMAGISDRTLRTYNKISLRESLDPYIKLMSGFKDNGFLDREGVEEHLESVKSGEFKGFYYENLYQRISTESPEFIQYIHFTVCFYDSWTELADQRNIPQNMLKEKDNDKAIEWFKGLYPYNEFNLDLLFEIHLGKKQSSEGGFIWFEAGFAMLVALAMDFYTASNKDFQCDDLASLIQDSFDGKKILSQWFESLRDESFCGSKEEFYEEYAQNSLVDDGSGSLVCMDKDNAKRTYIRMCSKGAADWKQIIRIANTIYRNQPTQAISLALRFALLRCINLYVKKLKESDVTLTEKELKEWTAKWADNFRQHNSVD